MRRRELFTAAAGSAALVRPAVAAAQAGPEPDAVARALRFEHASVFAYDEVIRSELLAGRAAALARRLREHEAEHADALAERAAELGARSVPPPRRTDQVEFPQLRGRLDSLRAPADAVALLVEVERLSHDVHRAAIARLRDARNIQLAATILAAEASHLVAWRAVR
jgi:Ferritin-like domain